MWASSPTVIKGEDEDEQQRTIQDAVLVLVLDSLHGATQQTP